MLIDVHCHIDFPQFDEDRNIVIENAKKENVFIVNSGMGPNGIKNTLKLIEKHKNVFATFGLSPQEFDSEIIEKTITLIKENRKDKILAVGEVGLDYFWVKDLEKRKEEIENFYKFIDLSRELKLPLVIHSRDAEKDIIEILGKENLKALLHCFSGSVKQADEAVSLGCLISIPTSIIYSKQKQILAEKIPLESIVLETDAPYLSPSPGTRNVPMNVKLSAKKIAEIKIIDTKIVEEITTKNAINFFNLKL